MSITRTFRCDGQGCQRHVVWDCLLRYASQFEPETIIRPEE